MALTLKSGFMVLAGRSVFTKILQVLSSLVLAYHILPTEYGTFGIIYGFLSSLIFLTDIGLGDQLIQKKEAVLARELGTYILFRFFIGIFWCLVFSLLVPVILNYYKLNIPYAHYIFLTSLILPLEAFIGGAIIYTQKNLDFKSFAKVEMYELVILYMFQISLALLGFGIWSFFIAILVSRILKCLYCLILIRGKVEYDFDLTYFSGKFKSGFYFQLNSILPTSKAMFLPVILALFLDVHSIGIIFWVTSLVSMPLALAYNYNTLLFPGLSKVQDNINAVKELSSRSIEKMLLIFAFIFGLGGFVGHQLIDLIFSKNWIDAKELIYLCAFFHFLYASRYIVYPMLYVRKLEKQRTKGEFYLILAEYVLAFVLCSLFKSKGYFISLILINFVSFFYFTFKVKDWLRKESFRRYLNLVCFFILIGIIHYLTFKQSTTYTSLALNIFIFVSSFLGFNYLIDYQFRDLLNKLLLKRVRI